MPYIKFSAITPAVATQIANVLKQFTDKNVEVWLRFAHEMNYYTQDGANGGKNTYPGGSKYSNNRRSLKLVMLSPVSFLNILHSSSRILYCLAERPYSGGQ